MLELPHQRWPLEHFSPLLGGLTYSGHRIGLESLADRDCGEIASLDPLTHGPSVQVEWYVKQNV